MLPRPAEPSPPQWAQARSFDSFPASLDRVKGVPTCRTLDASPDGMREQRRPLRGIEVAGGRAAVEAELCFELLQLRPGDHGARSVSVPAREERTVGACIPRGDERLDP